MVLSIVWEFLRNVSTSVLTPPLRTVQYFRTIPVQYSGKSQQLCGKGAASADLRVIHSQRGRWLA